MNGEALSLTCATISFFVGWCIALIMDWALHKFMEIKNDEPLPEDSEGDQLCTVSRAQRTLLPEFCGHSGFGLQSLTEIRSKIVS